MRNNLIKMPRIHHIKNVEEATKIRMQLAVLLHAKKYQFVDDNDHNGCAVPFCQIGRDVWKHMKTCTIVENCSEKRCKLSRQILIHWKMCSKSQKFCIVCTPLKVYKTNQTHKFEVPDCRTSRHLISHYKECSSSTMDCKRCDVIMRFKRKTCGSQSLPKQGIRHSALLQHSCRCVDRTCQIPMCIKMKRVLTHTNVCQCRGSCSIICKEIAIFCLNHSIKCTQQDCILSTKA